MARRSRSRIAARPVSTSVGCSSNRRPTVCPFTRISAEEYVATLVADGFGEDDAHHLADMYALMERGTIAETTDGVEPVFGRPPRTFEDYVLRTAATGVWDR